MKGRPKVSKELRSKSAAIAQRMKEARTYLGLTQEAAATRCGIKRVSYAAYEEGRNVIPAGVGILFCLAFDVSFRWLASGKGELKGCERLSAGRTMAVPEEAAFSAAFDAHISPGIAPGCEAAEANNSYSKKHADELMNMFRGRWLQTIPEADLGDFLELLSFIEHGFRRNKLEFLRRFSREFRSDLQMFPGNFSQAISKLGSPPGPM